MKKLMLVTELDLGKEIIANLSDEQLQQIEGGLAASDCGCPSCTGQSSGTSCSKEATVEAGN